MANTATIGIRYFFLTTTHFAIPMTLALIVAGLVFPTATVAAGSDAKPKSGALAALPSNHSYFQDASGKPLMLVGDYTWGIFSDNDYEFVRFLDAHKKRGLNFARIWLWWGAEQLDWEILGAKHIEPYMRTGPGLANDGKPKYDLTKFNPAFFERLVDFCEQAHKRGIYLHLIIMDGWMLKHKKLWNRGCCDRANLAGIHMPGTLYMVA